MLTVTLPDGNQKQFPGPISVYDLAISIAPSLAKATIAGEVDGRQVDTNYLIEQDARVKLITAKDKAGLEILRHSTAHLLAHAVKELFGDQAQVTIGPVIEDGFYYDFAFNRTFTPTDLEQIEAKMREIAARNIAVVRKTMKRDEAIAYFRELGEFYKAEIIESIPANETLSLYEEGNFVDLCRGPHVPNTKWLKVFKLMKVAGAYWRGDSKNAMLQRIYGTAWFEKADLDLYLHRLEEAEKRDHRKIGKALDLFHTQEDSPGMVFWHPNGWVIYQVIEQYIRNLINNNGYQEIRTPLILSAQLWQKSGHWENFRDDMFVTQAEERELAVKPMNCPGAIQVFNQGLKSYRDLPLRLGEFGSCQRNEASGALHGLMRVRSFVQDDAHIFCTEDQIQEEVAGFIDLLYKAYRDFGFDNVLIKLSTRPAKRVGSDEIWDKAEHALERALNAKGLAWELSPGEGAFYGPKIEFSLRDCLGRVWQCGTMQVDFSMPQRLGAEYVAEDNTRQTPVMLHRAIVGSLERFIGILIEHHAGQLPVWLSPTQVVVMNITDKQAEYAKEVAQNLKLASFRAKLDLRNEKIGFKIREQTLQRVPYLLVVGDREMTEQTVAVRTRSGKDLGSMPLAVFIEKLNQDVAQLGRIALEE